MTNKADYERASARPHWSNYILVFAVICILAYYFMPLRLERVGGWHGASRDEIVTIAARASWSNHDGYVELPTIMITEESVITEILDTLSGHTMRRQLDKNVYYASTDREKPTWVHISIMFSDGSTSYLTTSSGASLSVNGRSYHLYGNRIDTLKLWRLIEEHLDK